MVDIVHSDRSKDALDERSEPPDSRTASGLREASFRQEEALANVQSVESRLWMNSMARLC